MNATQATTETAQAMLRSIYQARAVLRSVELAAAAQEDGAVNYSDGTHGRAREAGHG